MRTAKVLVISTRAASGEYEDTAGPIAVEFLKQHGFDTPDPIIVADNEVESAVAEHINTTDVLLTSGGTGLTPDDRTVEAVEKHLERTLDGIVQAFYQEGLKKTPHAILSRAVAGTTSRTFVMTLPGSRGGVKDGCTVLDTVIDHLIDTLQGKRNVH